MALIQCSECKADISDQASTCPKCGFKRPSRDWAKFRLGVRYSAFLGLLFLAVHAVNMAWAKMTIPVILPVLLVFVGGIIYSRYRVGFLGMVGFILGGVVFAFIVTAFGFVLLMLFAQG